jgi:hypothetical protein
LYLTFSARFRFLVFLSIRKRGLTLHLHYKVLTGGAEIKVHVGFVAIHKEKWFHSSIKFYLVILKLKSMMVLPGGAEVEVHHVADAIAVEDGVDRVQRDREEGNSEGQTQLK